MILAVNHGTDVLALLQDWAKKRKVWSMDNFEIRSIADRLRRCADELSDIAKTLCGTTRIEVPPETAAEIESRHGALAKRLVEALAVRGVEVKIVDVSEGPTVMRFKFELPSGVRYSTLTELCDEIQCALALKSLRIEAPIPGEEYVGIEVPKDNPEKLTFGDTVYPSLLNAELFQGKVALPFVVGKGVDGRIIAADLSPIPHLIIGGAIGQGKSCFVHSLLCGLIASRSPEEVQFIIADTKYVEYTQYEELPHLVVPVITDNRKIVFALHWAVAEMEKRLTVFAQARARNIADFNSRGTIPHSEMFDYDGRVASDASLPKSMPYIVIVIDDFADAMDNVKSEIESDIQRITQKARAAGIHIVLATNRPGEDVLPGGIRANVPGRIAFKTASEEDSRILVDEDGAERLLGKGDCLFRRKDGLLCRVQTPDISDAEIAAVVAEAKRKYAAADNSTPVSVSGDSFDAVHDEGAAITDDELVAAIKVIRKTQRASTSHFQRRLGYGYTHASRLMERLENEGYVSPPGGAKPWVINWNRVAEFESRQSAKGE